MMQSTKIHMITMFSWKRFGYIKIQFDIVILSEGRSYRDLPYFFCPKEVVTCRRKKINV